MLDTRTGHFQEWPAPEPLTSSYDAEVDKNGDAWTAGMTTDRVLRLDTKSGQYTEYLTSQKHEYPQSLSGQHHEPGIVLGRQQSRRFHRQAGTIGIEKNNS